MPHPAFPNWGLEPDVARLGVIEGCTTLRPWTCGFKNTPRSTVLMAHDLNSRADTYLSCGDL